MLEVGIGINFRFTVWVGVWLGVGVQKVNSQKTPNPEY